MFQTALPFGYLIQFLLFAAGVAGAWVLIARGAGRRDRASYRSGLVLAAMMAMLVGWAAAQPSVDDWQPTYASGAILGRWVADDGRSLELRPDSTYTLRDGSSVVTGRYDTDNEWHVLDLVDSTGRRLPTARSDMGLTVVEADGEYRIVNQPVDPDAWDGWLGYRRTPPAKAP